MILGASALLFGGCSPSSAPGETAADASVSTEETPSLNLSTDLIGDALTEEGEVGEAESVLPDMFDDREEAKTKISGKVLTNEEAQTLQDSVDGVQLELEVPTN